MNPDPSPPTPIDDYIAGFPLEVRTILEQIRTLIREVAPEAKETMSYQIPTFTLHGNLVHFAAFAKHIGFYPTPTGIAAFAEELSVYKGNKGSVQFPLDQPMPYELMRRIVVFRVRENVERAKAKGNRNRRVSKGIGEGK